MDIEIQRQFLLIAYQDARNSPDPSTQNAALLVDEHLPLDPHIICAGINEFPRGVEYKPERWERPLKYKIIEHAERNAVYSAARNGLSTQGLTMVSPWAACCDCSRAIIQAGIKKLVTHKQADDMSPAFWREEIDIAHQMLSEAGVEIIFYDGIVGCDFEVLHSGKKWKP